MHRQRQRTAYHDPAQQIDEMACDATIHLDFMKGFCVDELLKSLVGASGLSRRSQLLGSVAGQRIRGCCTPGWM